MREARWRLWIQELRAPFLTASIIPISLGGAIAWARGVDFHWGYFLLTLLAGTLLHAGTNVANDYFDHLSGNDQINEDFVRPYTGGSRLIQRGLLTPREVLLLSLLCYAGGSALGLVLAATRGWIILVLGTIGLLSGFFYTAPPLRLAHRALGELLVGVNFGVLMTLGAFYVQTRKLDWEPVVGSLPIALLVAAILYVNEFQDYSADKAVGKAHLVVRLGKPAAERGFWILLAATYSAVVVPALLGATSPFVVLALLTLPIALLALRTLQRHREETVRLAPANAAVIMTHLLTGLLLTIGYILHRLLLA